MKPITENEEFKAQVEKRFARIGINDPTGLACKAEYVEGAKAAQSILQKEHEEDMEEFARWINKSAELQLFKERDGR